MGVMYNLHYLGFSWCWDLSIHVALLCLGLGFSAMPHSVWIDYGADWSVLLPVLPVLRSVILHIGLPLAESMLNSLSTWLSCALWMLCRRTDPVVGACLSCLESFLDVPGPFNGEHRRLGG